MRLFQFLVIASLLFTLGGSPAQQVSAAKTQPLLVQMAAQDPGQMVRVIAQKVAGSLDAETQVAKLGGTVTKELNIIYVLQNPHLSLILATVSWNG